MSWPKTSDYAWVIFVARWILGLMFFFAGIYKFILGPLEYAREMSVMRHAVASVPASIWWAGALVTPFVELSIGVLLLLGLWTRQTLWLLGAVLILATLAYGVDALYHPVGTNALALSPVNDYLISRVALLVVVLYPPREHDRYSVDSLLRGLSHRP